MQEIFGVAAIKLEESDAHSSDLASNVGRRRDEVCRNLLELILELCSEERDSFRACDLELLVAAVQLCTGASF